MAAPAQPAPARDATGVDATDSAVPMEDDAVVDAATAAVNAEGGLTEAQLLEIFKQTSVFNVRSAMANNEVLMGADGGEHDNER